MPVAEVTAQTAADPKPSDNAPAVEEGEHQREAELAAAWANWRQIRESIVESQLTSQIADAAAAELKEIQREELSPAMSEPAVSEPAVSQKEEVAAEPASDGSSSASSADSTAISAIVDSVLAELKPKLIEEIAKKMRNERNKKKKE